MNIDIKLINCKVNLKIYFVVNNENVAVNSNNGNKKDDDQRIKKMMARN